MQLSHLGQTSRVFSGPGGVPLPKGNSNPRTDLGGTSWFSRFAFRNPDVFRFRKDLV